VVSVDSGLFPSASLVRLSGPSLESKLGITLGLGGAAVGPGGLWKAAGVEEVVRSEGEFKVRIPAARVALITLRA